MSDWLPRLPLTVLVVLALGLGLASVGGPGQGRAETRDRTRLDDLNAMEAWAVCLARAADGTLPATLAETAACPAPARLADPYTGAPYRYARIGARSFRLCAGFETALPQLARASPGRSFTPETGCLTITLPPAPR